MTRLFMVITLFFAFPNSTGMKLFFYRPSLDMCDPSRSLQRDNTSSKLNNFQKYIHPFSGMRISSINCECLPRSGRNQAPSDLGNSFPLAVLIGRGNRPDSVIQCFFHCSSVQRRERQPPVLKQFKKRFAKSLHSCATIVALRGHATCLVSAQLIRLQSFFPI